MINAFQIDVIASLVAAYKSENPADISGPVSILLYCPDSGGGSAGVNRIMRALGFRSDQREEEVTPRPPENRAWVAVRVKRKNSASDVFIRLRAVGPAANVPNAPAPFAGTIGFRRARLSTLLFRDLNRFPQNGGYTVLPDTVYSITAESRDKDGNPLTALGNTTYVFAPGAIVDYDVTL